MNHEVLSKPTAYYWQWMSPVHSPHHVPRQGHQQTNMEKTKTGLDRSSDRRKWDWLGQTNRKPLTSMVPNDLRWNPNGKQMRIRPSNAWRRAADVFFKGIPTDSIPRQTRRGQGVESCWWPVQQEKGLPALSGHQGSDDPRQWMSKDTHSKHITP